MSNLASLITLLGAGYAGYNKGVNEGSDILHERKVQAAERDKLDYEKSERTRAVKLRDDLAASQRDIALENGTTTTGTNVYANPEDAAYDANELNRMNRQAAANTGTQAPAPVAPAPIARLGTQLYNDQAQAQEESIGINSEAAKMKRAGQVMAESGDIERAQKYFAFAKTAMEEGSDKLIAGIQGAAPSVDALTKAKGGIVQSTIGQENADVFNKTGGRWKVTPDTKVEYYLAKDPAGRDIVNARVLGKDGKPVVDDVRSAALMMADIKTRLQSEQADRNDYLTVEQQKESKRVNDATIAHQNRTFKLASENANKDSLENKLTQVETVLGRKLTGEERTSYGKKLLGIDKGDSEMDKFVQDVVKEGVKAGTIKPEDAATSVVGIKKSFAALAGNEKIANTLRTELAGKKPGTPEYQTVWDEAKTELGMTDQQLTAMGFAAPPTQKAPAKAAATMGSGAAPSAYVPPPNSFAAKRAQRIADEHAAQAAIVSKTQEEFNADMAALSPLDLAQKYDSFRSRLTREQKIALQNAERNIR